MALVKIDPAMQLVEESMFYHVFLYSFLFLLFANVLTFNVLNVKRNIMFNLFEYSQFLVRPVFLERSFDNRYNAIVNEHPQTIAVITTCLPPARAAHIIEGLPPERQLSVIRRIASLRQIELAMLIPSNAEISANITCSFQ